MVTLFTIHQFNFICKGGFTATYRFRIVKWTPCWISCYNKWWDD